MKIGDIVIETPSVDFADGIPAAERGPRKGRVVGIHPQQRFYRVEFTARNGAVWRECFYFPDRRGNPNASMSLAVLPGSHRAHHKISKSIPKEPLYGR